LDAAGPLQAAADHCPTLAAVLGKLGDRAAILMQAQNGLEKAQWHPQYRQQWMGEQAKGDQRALSVQAADALDFDGLITIEQITSVKTPFDQALAFTAERTTEN
jgi:hypothetical protein